MKHKALQHSIVRYKKSAMQHNKICDTLQYTEWRQNNLLQNMYALHGTTEKDRIR